MSGKKYTLKYGGDSEAGPIRPTFEPKDQEYSKEQIKEPNSPESSPRTDVISRESSPSTDVISTESSPNILEVPPESPAEVQSIYSKVNDFLNSKDIKKFDQVEQIQILGINGIPITQEESKALYEYNPFMFITSAPNDDEIREELMINNEEFTNITVNDFLVKQYETQIKHYDNDFMLQLYADSLFFPCSYCYSESSSTQSGGAKIDTGDAAIQDFITHQATRRSYLTTALSNPIGFIDIFKYTSAIYRDTGFNPNQVNTLLEKIINFFLYRLNKTNKVNFRFKTFETAEGNTANKTSYVLTTGPTFSMKFYEAGAGALNLLDYTGVRNFDKDLNYANFLQFCPSIKSKEHVIKAFLLKIILQTVAITYDSGAASGDTNVQLLKSFLSLVIGQEFTDTSEESRDKLAEYFDIKIIEYRDTDTEQRVDNINVLESFVTRFLRDDVIPTYLITNISNRSVKTDDINIYASINDFVRGESRLSECCNLARLNKVLNLLYVNLLYGNDMENSDAAKKRNTRRYQDYIKYFTTEKINKQFQDWNRILDTNDEKPENDHWFKYNFDSRDNKLSDMIFYKRYTPPSKVAYLPKKPPAIFSLQRLWNLTHSTQTSIQENE